MLYRIAGYQIDQKALMRHPIPMNLVLDATSPAGVGVRQHLTEQLRKALLAGQVSAGDPLPSTRTLASTMRISRGTVVSVYEDLAGEGYVVVCPGSGTFAAFNLPSGRNVDTPARQPWERKLSSDSKPTDGQPSVSSSAVVNLWPGSPSSRLRSNRDWKAAWRNALKREPLAFPPGPAGSSEVRQLIAHHLASARGIQCSADEIVITAGTSDGLSLLIYALRERQQEPLQIATEDPGYPAARHVIARLGGEAVPIAVHDGGMDPAAVGATPGSFVAALLTPSHQYPLGGRLPVAARLAMLDWAHREGAFLVEDDYDSEFRHGAPALPAIASLDTTGRVVHLGSYSKTLTPWLRCGYLVVPDPELRANLLAVRTDLGQPVSGVVQAAVAEFLRSGGFRRHLGRMGREYAHRRKLVLKATADLRPQICVGAVEGGLHATLSWNNGPTTREIVTRLDEHSVRVAPLTEYYHSGSPRTRDGIVFGYGAPTDLQLQSALRTIATVLQEAQSAQT